MTDFGIEMVVKWSMQDMVLLDRGIKGTHAVAKVWGLLDPPASGG